MGTGSTKSRRKESAVAAPASGAKKAAEAVPADKPTELSQRTWLIASAAVMLVAAFLRLYQLTLVPLHHDEGVNGNFLVTLVRSGEYVYNPTNYHGPTLYYFAAIIPWLARFFGGPAFRDAHGLTTFNIRLVTVLFGLGTVWLVLLLRRRIGDIGALSAAGMLAISPGAVYLSRYFIHETLFVFFALGVVVAVLKYYESGRWAYLILASVSAALMTATKETWIINSAVLLIAFITANLYFWARRAPKAKAGRLVDFGNSVFGLKPNLAAALGYPIVVVAIINLIFEKENRFVRFHALQSLLLHVALILTSIALIAVDVISGVAGIHWIAVMLLGLVSGVLWKVAPLLYVVLMVWAAVKAYQGRSLMLPIIGRVSHQNAAYPFLERFGGAGSVTTSALIAIAVFIIVNVLFYSSFLRNYPKGVNDALLTLSLWSGRTQEHVHSAGQYLEWLRESESPILIVAIVGAAYAVWRADNRFAVFVAQWAFGSLAAYSMVGYKTPWIALNFVVPMAITGGYVLDVLYRKVEGPIIPLALAIGAIAFLGYEINLRQNWYLGIPLVLALGYLIATFSFWNSSIRNQQRVHFYLTAAAVIVVCSAQMYALNFVHYDDDRYTYVYAHTRRDFLGMVDEVNRIAARTQGAKTGVTIVSPDYWPLPWYFRDLDHVGYFGRMTPSTEPVIIGSMANEAELRATFGDRYVQVRNPSVANGSYALRPGVDLLLFVRKDVAR